MEVKEKIMETSTMTTEMRVVHVPEEDTCSLLTRSYRYVNRPTYSFFKRFFDIFISGLGILVLSPVLLIVAILVKLTSKGPVLFRDHRMGKDASEITVYKFRTMFVDAEAKLKKYLTPEQLKQWEEERKIDNDPRITKLGKILRKTSLDELPQLFNIFNGTMSIVGPRAITRHEMEEHYSDVERTIVLSVRPGLTGYWQAFGRSNVTFESGKRQEMDLYYVYNRSLAFDFKIMLMTIPAVLKSDGAK